MLSFKGKTALHMMGEELADLGVDIIKSMKIPEENRLICSCPSVNAFVWLSAVYKETTGKPVPVPTDEQVLGYCWKLMKGMNEASRAPAKVATPLPSWVWGKPSKVQWRWRREGGCRITGFTRHFIWCGRRRRAGEF